MGQLMYSRLGFARMIRACTTDFGGRNGRMSHDEAVSKPMLQFQSAARKKTVCLLVDRSV